MGNGCWLEPDDSSVHGGSLESVSSFRVIEAGGDRMFLRPTG